MDHTYHRVLSYRLLQLHFSSDSDKGKDRL